MAIDAGPFLGLAQGLGRLLGYLIGAVIMVTVSWKFLKVFLSGGNDRAVRELVLHLVVIGVALAAFSNLPATLGLVQALGAAIWTAIAESVRASV